VRESIIKRIIGLEGDFIIHRTNSSIVRVPQGHCWLEGDNASASIDSNRYGPVPVNLIQGNAVRLLFPQELKSIRWFSKITNADYKFRRATEEEYSAYKSSITSSVEGQKQAVDSSSE
jgi:signal peptidase I